MKRLQLLLSFLALFCSLAVAGDVRKDIQKELDVITDRLVSAHLEAEVDEQTVSGYMDAIRSDGSFPDLDYFTVYEGAFYPAGTHLKRLKVMAIAYRKSGCGLYHSKKLLKRIVAGIDYWYKVRPASKNWWFGEIGAPVDYMVPLLLLKDKIDKKKLLHYSSYLRDLTGNKGHKGKNRTWVSGVTIHKGCIEDNIDLVRIGFESIASTIKIVSRQGDEGIKIDGSFHQHRPQLYSGGYGLSYADDIAYYLQLAKGTVFDAYFTSEKKDIFANLLLDGHRLLGYRGTFDFGSIGRNISRNEALSNISPVTLSRMEESDVQHTADYAAWRKHLSGAPFPTTGNKYFWKSDIMVQHGADYYLSAKVISTRTNGTEMLNKENLKGYNLPLGATNILTSGEEYGGIFPIWNWNRIPGTTAVQHPDSANLTGYQFGKNEFGGGVSNGKNGVIAYEHCYGGVKANKAYFFMDDVLVCLGAGIASDAPEEVVTTVNQCFFTGEMTVGKEEGSIACKENVSVKNPVWVHHGRVGYLFPMGGDVTVNSQKQSGSWRNINISESDEEVSDDVFNLWVNHGKEIRGGKYAYMVVPDKSLGDFQTFAATQDYKIIKNTDTIQAVKLNHQYAVVFYHPGMIELDKGLNLTADEKVMVYIEQKKNGYSIWAADPLYKQKEATLTLNGREVRIAFPTDGFTGSTTFANIAAVQPYDLKCEYLENPLGIDIPKPRLSWKLGTVTGIRGRKQTACQILVSSSEVLLAENRGDLWDSGRIDTAESVNIAYGGVPLVAGQKCFWKVRFSDEQNNWSSWSAPSFWRMGLFAGDWRAQWIGSETMEARSVGGRKVNNVMQDPWFRKTFSLKDMPQDAVVYVASVGYHELYVNGRKVGDAVLSPSVTDHKTRARYMTYDITDYLQPGDNVLALWLGTSWSVFPAYQRDDKPAIPMALVQAEITLPSGTELQILSDETWKTHASPNTLLGYWEAHHFEGECYDAALEQDNWNATGFDDSGWEMSKVYHPALKVSSDRTEPNRLIKEIAPVSIEETEPGVYRVDMGINYAGWFEMQLKGQPGDSIVFQFSEREKDACSYGIRSIYKVGPKRKGVFCNRFNYMTGRWVRISGLRYKPTADQVRGWLIRPDYRRSGGFECDIPLLNNIYRTTLWTLENLSLGNYVVDCPHRERCGYGGDALATTRTALGNYQLGAFYNKWMEDWRDVQGADGNVPYTAPTRIGGGGPSWSGFCVTLPWELYRQYGDKRVLSESFSTIRRWLGFLETKSQHNMLVRWGGKWSFLGDWLWPSAWPERRAMEKRGKALGDTRETLFFNNCHWIYNLETAAKIADVLGHKEEAAAYRKRASQVRKAVHDTFFDARDNSYVNGYPSYLAMALLVNLPPENLRGKVWKRLEREILVNRKGHFWGGITAGSFLLHTLLDNRRDDLILEMAMKEDFPSWGNMLKEGNGTFFEDWECRGSALHSSYLYIGSWFIEALGGIRRMESGYKQFVIAPWITEEGPQLVRSHYNSMYGKIVSNWVVDAGILNLEVTVPANTTAILKLSDIDVNTLKEGDSVWREAEGVSLHKQEGNAVSLALQSGTYRFSAAMKFKASGKNRAVPE